MHGSGLFYRFFLLKTPHLACSNTVSTTNLDETKALKTLESILPKMAQLTRGGEWKIGKIENQFWFNFIRIYTAEKNNDDNNDSSNNGDDNDNVTLLVTISQNLLGNIDDDDFIY